MSAALPIGALRHFVTLEAPVDTPDGAGGVSRVWSPMRTTRVRIMPVSGALTSRNDQTTSVVTHDVYFRATSGVTSAMQFRRGDRAYQILYFDNLDEKGATIRARCEETRA